MSKRILALFLAVVAALASVPPLWAQDSKRPIYSKGFEVTTDWQYSCSDGKGCSFNCPGSGGANNVTKLSIFLGSVPIGKMKILPVFFVRSLARKLCVVAGSPSQLE
jgi:hypothetical protein